LKTFLALLLTLASLFSHEIIVGEQDEFNITPETMYYVDKNSTLQNRQEVLAQVFQDTNETKLLLGYQFDATLWIKFTLSNPTDKVLEKIFEYDYPTLREYTLYDLNSGKEYNGGFLYAKEHPETLSQPIKLRFEPHSKRDFLIKAKSTDTGLIAKLKLWNIQAYYAYENYQQHILFLFLGAMGALFLYNLSVLLFTRDSAYLYYVIIILSFTTLELALSGYFHFIFHEYEVRRLHIYLLLNVMVFGVIMFSIRYLDLKGNLPRLYNAFLIMLGSVIVVTIFSSYDFIPTKVHRLYLMLTFILVVCTGFYAMYKKIPQAKYYIFGWLMLLLFIFITALTQIGFTSLMQNYPYVKKLSIFLEALMFSIALSARIRLLEQEKERVSLELYKQKEEESQKFELKVTERTQELEEALNDKHLFLQEVHHRVKNNLQIIISLLRLQADETEDKVLQQILGESENRVKAISNVHELLYQNETLEHIDTQVYFEQLCQDIKSSYQNYKHAKIIVDTKPSLSMDKAIYCGLIVNELITNAFKHAFDSDEGEINLILQKDEAQNFILMLR